MTMNYKISNSYLFMICVLHINILVSVGTMSLQLTSIQPNFPMTQTVVRSLNFTDTVDLAVYPNFVITSKFSSPSPLEVKYTLTLPPSQPPTCLGMALLCLMFGDCEESSPFQFPTSALSYATIVSIGKCKIIGNPDLLLSNFHTS